MDLHNRTDKLFTNTSITRYQDCPKKYKLYHIDKFDPYAEPLNHQESEGLNFGTLLHKCMEIRELGQDWMQTLRDASANFIFQEESYITARIRALIEARTILEDQMDLKRYPSAVIKNEVLIEKEMTMTSNTGEKYAGKIDRVVQNGSGMFTFDYKSRSRTPDYETFFEDQQQLLYCAILWHNGIEVNGYIIDVWRIPKSKPKKDRKGNGETYEEFGNRLRDEIVDISIRQLSGILEETDKPYFFTYEYPVTRNDLVTGYKNTEMWMHRLKRERHYPMNKKSCISHFGKCEWYDLCHGKVDIKDMKQRENEHPELKEIL